LTQPLRSCTEARPANCRGADEIEGWLRNQQLEILGAADAPRGRQHAKVLTLAVPGASGPIVFRAKWRAHSTSTVLNRPRKEIAAYAIQKFFLRPNELVVPPTAGHCFDIEAYRARVDPDAKPSFPTTRCVYGVLSYWLEDAFDAKRAAEDAGLDAGAPFDRALFWRDSTYRSSLAHVNLVAHIISHGDSHSDQFVFTADGFGLMVHLVDNGTSFSSFRNPKLKSNQDWSSILVPALPRRAIDRLKRLPDAEIEALRVVEQLENRHGLLVATRSSPAAPDADGGLRWRDGDLQVGLTVDETRSVRRRIGDLIARAEAGELRLFESDHRPSSLLGRK
jgi:hypothetical protein